ncbi:MAG: hypothetical protein H7222_17880 [Methylotenera sp.]|nr:hypothetical protein [Oligoflexia bacterium]
MQKRQSSTSKLPYKKDPGDTRGEAGGSGSIEHELDMVESGDLRGDLITHRISSRVNDQGDDELDLVRALKDEDGAVDSDPRPLTEILNDYNLDMSEDNREGDEMSGDDHSLGMQGGETEEKNQIHIRSGLPGEETDHDELEDLAIEKKRAS